MSLINKKTWLDRIRKYAWDGEMDKAKKLINRGKKVKGYKITEKNATKIIQDCGLDIRYKI